MSFALILLIAALIIGYIGMPLWVWSVFGGVVLMYCEAGFIPWVVYIALNIIFHAREIRIKLVDRAFGWAN